MKIIKIVLLFILLSGVFFTGNIFACEMTYRLISSDASVQSITPDSIVSLNQGEVYLMEVNFYQDHGVCDVKAEDTDFMLEEEKWKVSKDYLPLGLLQNIEWTQIESRKYRTTIEFTADEYGETSLQIVRDCERKAGYDETIVFDVL